MTFDLFSCLTKCHNIRIYQIYTESWLYCHIRIDFQNRSFLVFSVREMVKLSGEATLSKLFYLPSEKGSSLKGKHVLGEHSFFFRVDPCSEEDWCAGNKQPVTRVFSFVKKHG